MIRLVESFSSCCTDYFSYSILLTSVPMPPEISTLNTSPSLKNSGGFEYAPMPCGVCDRRECGQYRAIERKGRVQGSETNTCDDEGPSFERRSLREERYDLWNRKDQIPDEIHIEESVRRQSGQP